MAVASTPQTWLTTISLTGGLRLTRLLSVSVFCLFQRITIVCKVSQIDSLPSIRTKTR